MKHDFLRQYSVGLLALLLVPGGSASLERPNYTQDFAELRAGEYTLDPDHAYVIFRVERLGLSTIVGRLNSVDASLDFDPELPGELSPEGVIEVASAHTQFA